MAEVNLQAKATPANAQNAWGLAAHRYDRAHAAFEVSTKIENLAPEMRDALIDATCTAASLAFERMIQTPAPSPRDLVHKLKALALEMEDGLEISREHMLALLSDAERMFGEP